MRINRSVTFVSEDPVYMQDNIARQECVLSDVGKIYVGTHNKPVGRPWVFGQVYL